jgi:hypothetical protein
MNIEKLKKYLQHYLDSVILPRFQEVKNEDKIESLQVFEILKGSYQPPIVHVFLYTTPSYHPNNRTKSQFKKLEKDIEDFIRMFGITNPTKVHINKAPVYPKGSRAEEI